MPQNTSELTCCKIMKVSTFYFDVLFKFNCFHYYFPLSLLEIAPNNNYLLHYGIFLNFYSAISSECLTSRLLNMFLEIHLQAIACKAIYRLRLIKLHILDDKITMCAYLEMGFQTNVFVIFLTF